MYPMASQFTLWLGANLQITAIVTGALAVVKFAMLEPATTANIPAAYQEALRGAPNAKLLLVTQVSNRTGLVTPVREIVAMARQRGGDTVVDAAHGIACLDFKIDDLGADFVGWSVHKWTSAPLGTGAMYIRRSRIMAGVEGTGSATVGVTVDFSIAGVCAVLCSSPVPENAHSKVPAMNNRIVMIVSPGPLTRFSPLAP